MLELVCKVWDRMELLCGKKYGEKELRDRGQQGRTRSHIGVELDP